MLSSVHSMANTYVKRLRVSKTHRTILKADLIYSERVCVCVCVEKTKQMKFKVTYN